MLRTDTEYAARESEGYSAMRDLVEATNLVGVITQAWVSQTGPLLEAVAARLCCPPPIRGAGAIPHR